MKQIKGGSDGGAGCSYNGCTVYDSNTGVTFSGQCYSDGQGANPCYCHTTNGPTNYSGSHCIL